MLNLLRAAVKSLMTQENAPNYHTGYEETPSGCIIGLSGSSSQSAISCELTLNPDGSVTMAQDEGTIVTHHPDVYAALSVLFGLLSADERTMNSAVDLLS